MGAVAVELVHLASLYHDDVIDEATIRRNVESVNSRFGNLVAIVAGDYLLARSAAIAAGLGTEIAALLADTLGRLCQGQVTEVRSAFQIGRSRDDYVASISRQDGGAHRDVVPDRRAHRRAARTRGRGVHGVRALLRHGVPDPRRHPRHHRHRRASCKKPAGQDLAEGVYTLPALVALDDPDAGPDLRALLGQPLAQPERDKARAIVVASRGIAESVDEARCLRRGREGGHRRDRRARTAGGALPAGGRAPQRPAGLAGGPPGCCRRRCSCRSCRTWPRSWPGGRSPWSHGPAPW